MKRILLSFVFLLIGIVAIGCEVEDPEDVETLSYPEEETFFRLRTNVTDFEADRPLELVTITSVDELNDYRDEAAAYYDLDFGDPSFNDAVDSYDEAYFEDNVLFLVPVEETSGSVMHYIQSVTLVDDEVVIEILRNQPNIGTTDMAAWHIFVPVDITENEFDEARVEFNQ